jgi:hypothetical protein
VALVWPPLLAAAGFVLHFELTTRFAIYRRRPWEAVMVSAAGVVLGLYRLWLAPGVQVVAVSVDPPDLPPRPRGDRALGVPPGHVSYPGAGRRRAARRPRARMTS